MKALDRFLQRWRISKARPFIAPGATVLDIGCADGALFKQFGERIGRGVGMDPHLSTSESGTGYELVPGFFPKDLKEKTTFDAVTSLAMLEHVPREQQKPFAEACHACLKPGGYLIVSVPSPKVDVILDVLKFFRVIDGMDLDQHYGFDPMHTPELFESTGLKLVLARRFQLGLNHLFVFQKPYELPLKLPKPGTRAKTKVSLELKKKKAAVGRKISTKRAGKKKPGSLRSTG